MVGVIGVERGEVMFVNVFYTGADKLYSLERPPIRVSGRVSLLSNCHNIVLMIDIVVFKLDGVRVYEVFLIDDDLLTIVCVVGEMLGVVYFASVRTEDF